MNRRLLLSFIGLSPLVMIASKIPSTDNSIIDNLIKRWKNSKEYTLAVLETMPEDDIEYTPTKDQMSFAQHFMHLGFTNNMFIGILLDSKTYQDFNSLKDANFFIERPDPINLFQPDNFKKRDSKTNKALVLKYVSDTFDYVISSLAEVNDSDLTKGEAKIKPEFLSGHSNLDLILRAEGHTTHHRAQAVAYLRTKGIRPPKYTPYNKL